MRVGERGRTQHGFTYLLALFLVMLLGLGLAGTAETWTLASQRAHERELLWVGNQYARALQAYYLQSPGPRQYPAQLQDLLEDRRFPETRHHLRQLYPDPVSGQPLATVPTADGRVAGVRSTSGAEPFKRDNFPARWQQFKGSRHYSDWLFTAETAVPARAVAPGAVAPASSARP
jgi:type II secretory pathway pseudopilin PulG